MIEALETTGTFPELAVRNHLIRLQTVKDILLKLGVRNVADLGCGDGKLIELLADEPSIDRILGVESSESRLDSARERIATRYGSHKVKLLASSFLELSGELNGLDAVVMVESIEHIPEDKVTILADEIFGRQQLKVVVVTTPDATKRLSEEKLQQRGHLFEWDIIEFQNWANDVVMNYPYTAEITQLSGPTFIRNTQVGIFQRLDV